MARYIIEGEPADLEKAKKLLIRHGYHTTRIYNYNDGAKRFLAAYLETKTLYFVSESNGEPTITLKELEDKIANRGI